MAEHAWRNLAEDAVNDLFKQYVADQFLAVVRQQIGVDLFVINITAAKDRRVDALDAINAL